MSMMNPNTDTPMIKMMMVSELVDLYGRTSITTHAQLL